MSTIWKIKFTLYALISLTIWYLLPVFGVEYDSRSIGSWLILTEGVWAFQFWLPQEILSSFNSQIVSPLNEVISKAIGIGICILVDVLIATRSKLKKK